VELKAEKTVGLKNIHYEGFPFGRGWNWNNCETNLVSPEQRLIPSIPLPYSPAQTVQAEVVLAPGERVEKYRKLYGGKLRGKIVLLDKIPEPRDTTLPTPATYTDAQLKQFEQPLNCPVMTFGLTLPTEPVARRCFLFLAPEKLRDEAVEHLRALRNELWKFLASEQVAGIIVSSHGPKEVLSRPLPDFRLPSDANPLPGVIIGQDDYAKIANLAKKQKVVLSIQIKSWLETERNIGMSVTAELLGRDPKKKVVMLGAHLDSWWHGQGAADNAAGVGVVLEAMRVISKLPQPKRTIRVAFWGGEEQGLLGSKDYAATDHAGNIKMYFNVDSGSGRIRGLYAEKFPQAAGLLKRWLEPTGETTVALQLPNPLRSDYLPFAEAGIPAFGFVQDPTDEEVYHSTADTAGRLHKENLRQAAQVVAWVVYQAANANNKELLQLTQR